MHETLWHPLLFSLTNPPCATNYSTYKRTSERKASRACRRVERILQSAAVMARRRDVTALRHVCRLYREDLLHHLAQG
eukprot:SAG11_NODE_31034_length_295_cov_1.056122_1_plen_77_part_10